LFLRICYNAVVLLPTEQEEKAPFIMYLKFTFCAFNAKDGLQLSLLLPGYKNKIEKQSFLKAFERDRALSLRQLLSEICEKVINIYSDAERLFPKQP